MVVSVRSVNECFFTHHDLPIAHLSFWCDVCGKPPPLVMLNQPQVGRRVSCTSMYVAEMQARAQALAGQCPLSVKDYSDAELSGVHKRLPERQGVVPTQWGPFSLGVRRRFNTCYCSCES